MHTFSLAVVCECVGESVVPLWPPAHSQGTKKEKRNTNWWRTKMKEKKIKCKNGTGSSYNNNSTPMQQKTQKIMYSSFCVHFFVFYRIESLSIALKATGTYVSRHNVRENNKMFAWIVASSIVSMMIICVKGVAADAASAGQCLQYPGTSYANDR